MTLLAVAALSARLMAEAAARDGFDVVALDLFGDVDTCRVASRWFPIGEPGAMRIAAAPVLATLATLARRGDIAGWVAGSGFEAEPGLLAEAASLLPLIGTAPEAVRRVRDPATFFGFLDRLGIGHPPVCMTPPADGNGWLMKDARGCGGWHIRRASIAGPASEHHYFQREAPGSPMSATFIANGHDAVVLGCNQLIVRPFGTLPHVYCGAIGPVAIEAGLASRIEHVVRALAEAFSLRGLGSLDFLCDGDGIDVLELNPRPPASIALYADQALMAAHWQACTEGTLPARPGRAARVQGIETVFARRPLRLSATAARQLADGPNAHDLPGAASRFEAGEPVCSVSASGADAAEVQAHLNDRRDALSRTLETLSP